MSSGLLALLDDVAAIAKVAATSVDDVAALAAKAGTKSAGVLIDDAAVTPRYVVGFAADRELPIIYKITKGSLKNKLLFLLPGALLLSLVAPWIITPLLMLGGLFLCFEGAEKIAEKFFPHGHASHADQEAEVDVATAKTLEDKRVQSAIKTDFILSAEIMALTLSTVAGAPLWQQAAVLALVGIGVTLLVYGAVALIVKADDFGLALATRKTVTPLGPASQALGRGIVKFMPLFLKLLATVGTIAMLLVGGGILLHGLEVMGVTEPAHFIHEIAAHIGHLVPSVEGVATTISGQLITFILGLVIGLILIPIVTKLVVPLARSVMPKAKT